MKLRLLSAFVIGAVFLTFHACAAESEAASDLKALVTKIQTKIRLGETTEADVVPELKEFDALLAKYKAEKTDDVAQILLMKAVLYQEVLKQPAKWEALLEQLQRDFPDSKQAKQVEALKLRASLAAGAKFPDFDVKDTSGKPLSIANYKGKVVLLDFWATWCGPCVGEIPNVIKTYEAYHSQGFEVIGISLDQNQQKLASFTKEKNMGWPQYFDGLAWQNKLALRYGISSIPATFLIDAQGIIIGRDLRGEALAEAVAKAVTKK